MKIAILGIRGVPARYGGFETFAEELGARLVERGHEVTVYCRAYGDADRSPLYRGMRRVLLPTVRSKHFDTVVHTLLASLHVMFSGAQAVYYCNVVNSPFALLPRLMGKKTVLNVDGLEWKRAKWGRTARAVFRAGERLAGWCANRLVADSRGIARYYLERYGVKAEFIAYGAVLRPPVAPGPALRRLGLEQRRYVLYVSRLEPENNAHVLVQAYEKTGGDLPLVLVGQAPHARGYIESLHRTRDPRIRFAGGVYGEEYFELLSHAYLYVHGNEVGGTNPALLQAMAMGNCVVVNDVPFNREVVGPEAGYWFAYNDPASLREVLDHLIAHPEAADAVRPRAVERIRTAYTWQEVTDRTEGLLLGLSGKRRA